MGATGPKGDPGGGDGTPGATGATGPIGGSDTQILYNNAGVAAGDSALTFNQSTGILTSFALTVTNAASIAGNLNMNYQNITNLTTANFNISPSTPFVATGYASTFYNATTDRTYYVFNSLASGSITVASSAAVEYFALGGGGGGGGGSNDMYAGGGAGGLQTNNYSIAPNPTKQYLQIGTGGTLAAGTYTINVGAGGDGGTDSVVGGAGYFGDGLNGSNTTFTGPGVSVTAYGGGGGGRGQDSNGTKNGANGGCGGGGGGQYQGSAGSGGTGSQGYAGGTGDGYQSASGGGGGIAVIGTDGANGSSTSGKGGDGTVYPASGTGSTGYGCGGAGGAYFSGSGPGGSAGGTVLGGSAGSIPTSGTANTGSGGGGRGGNSNRGTQGGNGSGGIFVISFAGTAGNTGTGAINVNSGGNFQISANSNIVLVAPTTISDTFLFYGKNIYIGGSTTGYGGITANGDGAFDLWWGSSGNGGENDRLWRFAWQNDRNVVIYTGETANWSTGTSTSDGRLKTSIVKTSLSCTDIVMTTDVIDFEWKAKSDLADGGKIHTGFIAQDLEGRIPDAVKDVGGTKLLHKEELVPILWKALQDTINRVAVLEQTISSLISQR
jgi:hypothetical protein